MKLILSEPIFEYEIRGLMMAFYPWTDFITEDLPEDPEGLYVSYPEENICYMRFVRGEEEFCRTIEMGEDRKEAKNEIKRGLYHLLKEANNNRDLPWGSLTGIRPVKIPMSDILSGKDRDECIDHLKKDYLVSSEKADLAYEVAERELKLIRQVDTEKGYSLYVDIPFCPTTCLYCSFTSYPLSKFKGRTDAYLDALLKELKAVAEMFKDRRPDTIYFGGGTPTTLEPEQLFKLLSFIVEHFDISNLKEWTVEAGRPDSITKEKLEVLKQFPVTRLSVNPQTMHQKTLDLIGRKHTVEELIRAYELVRETGFDNVNMDLIVGLPEETEEDILSTVDQVIAMDPENVTIHSLAIKRSARLNLEKSIYKNLKMDNSDDVMMEIGRRLQQAGLFPYYLYRQKNMAGNQENVGYAKPGKEGLYNILIMEEVEDIIACGAGAVSKRIQDSLITRTDNVKNLDQYIDRIDEMIDRKKKLFLSE